MEAANEVEQSLLRRLEDRKRRCHELHDEADRLYDQRKEETEKVNDLKDEVHDLKDRLFDMEAKFKKANEDIEFLMTSAAIRADRLRNPTAETGQPVANACQICCTHVTNRVSHDCGHTMCKQCVDRWEETDKGHLCVTCRQETSGYGLLFL